MIKQVKRSIIKAHKKILAIFHLVEENMIYLEGGLGSQILGTLEYINTNKAIDISYFSNPPRATVNGPDIWEWELDRYGIDLNFFKERVRSKPYKWQYALKPQIVKSKLSTSGEYVNPWSIGGGLSYFLSIKRLPPEYFRATELKKIISARSISAKGTT